MTFKKRKGKVGLPLHIRCSRFAASAMIVLFMISACLLTSCGRDVATIWSVESISPDTQWIAIARTDQYGGPGTAGIQSIVSLRQVKGAQDTIQILLLTQDTTRIGLEMTWVTSSHLEITYRKPASIDFQAIKCGGIDISVRDQSGTPNNNAVP